MMALYPTRFGMQPHKFGGLVTPPLKLRAFSFLSDKRTHPAIRNGVVDVAVVRKRQEPGLSQRRRRARRPEQAIREKGIRKPLGELCLPFARWTC